MPSTKRILTSPDEEVGHAVAVAVLAGVTARGGDVQGPAPAGVPRQGLVVGRGGDGDHVRRRGGEPDPTAPRVARRGDEEHLRVAGRLDGIKDLGQESHTQMPAPGKALYGFGNEGTNTNRPVGRRGNQGTAGAAQQDLHGLIQIAQRGGQAPDPEATRQVTQSCQTELQLNTPLVAQELVPLVHDHALQTAQKASRVRVAEHH